MQLPQPYFFTSPRTIALVDRAQMMPTEGPIADSIYGYHTFWAAEVPFIPASIGKDDRDFDAETTNRISRAVQRQVRFLYDLAQSRDNLSTFEMRFVAWPHPTGQAQVGIAFLGKTFHPNEQMSRKLALALWDKFSAVFPREVPFSYPLIAVKEQADAQTHSFQQWYEPIPFEQLTHFSSIVELRKYEDWPTLRNIGGVYHAHDYIPHPFVPALDYSAMARLFETMAHQNEPCIVAITVRPQQLTDQEELILHEHARWFERVANGEVDEDNPLAEVMQELKNDVFDAYPRAHAEQGLQVYNVLKRECRSLFTVRLQVIGQPIAQATLIEALGSEVMANAGNAYPSRWTRTEASTSAEFRWALFNLQWLEFARWGISPLIQQAPAIVRLRQLATVTEVSGAFRLPTAPGSAGLVGVEVRDEPFLPPLAKTNKHTSVITLGTIMDRGVPTSIPCLLPVNAFSGLTQLFGEASETRGRVLQKLFGDLVPSGIPWILLGSNEMPCEEIASQLNVRYIRADASFQALNLGFHPFLPPPNVSLTKFVDALIRVFIAVYMLDFSAVALLRRAFLQTYELAGWDEAHSGHPINLAMLAAQIEAVAHQPDVPTRLAELLLTRCVLALRDLAITAPGLTDAPYIHDTSWLEPCCIEFGWVGSDTNSALLRGCLWSWFALAFTAQNTRGLVAVMEAHTIFGAATEKNTASSGLTAAPSTPLFPIVTLAQHLAQLGTGTMCIDERPDLLSTEITTRANLTLLTQNSNTNAHEYVSTLIGASSRQRLRLYHLDTAEVVVALRNVPPVLMKL
jgi:hypothetical protein